MKKKILFFCFFVVMILVVLPASATSDTNKAQQLISNDTTDMEGDNEQGTLDSPLFTGYILIHVYTYTPGIGIQSYSGANISVRGFLYSYKGQTDEAGDCLFNVHTNLFRVKKYIVKVQIPPENWLHTQRISFFIEPREIVYKEFLFLVL